MFGAPAVLYVLAVAIWPLAQGFSYSFYDYSLLKPDATTLSSGSTIIARSSPTTRRATRS